MKKFLSSVVIVTSFFIQLLPVLAQTDFIQDDAIVPSSEAEQKTVEPVTIATVSIRDASIKKQNGNTLNVSFTLTNRVGFQPQVRYAVDILEVKESGIQILVDRKVYDETLALNEGERIEKEITYTAPDYLNGTYQVWIVSMNAQSMLFAQASAGEASFLGSGEVVSINQDTCRVFISDKPDEKYFVDQGVDISKEESLVLTCAVANNTKSVISVTPYFRTHYRSSLGAVVSKERGKDAILLQGKERKDVSITLPIANEPQAYDVGVFFVDTSDKQISSAVNTHYVLRGASATIQSIVLDKDYYAKDDMAKISFFWTGAADAFPDARGNGTTIGPVNISAIISNAAGKECGRVLDKKDTGGVSIINAPIVMDCVGPTVALSVIDKAGKVLAQSQFGVQAKTQTKTVGTEDQNQNNMGREGIFAIVLIVSLLFVIVFFFYQKRKSKNERNTNTPTPTQLLVFAFLLSGFLFTFNTARADTFFVGYDGVFTVNLNKDVYVPGETIRVTGSGTGGICGNGRQALALYTWNNQSPQVIFPPIDDKGIKYGDPNNPNDPLMFSNHSYKIQTVYSTKNFVAPTTQGPYKVSFTGIGRSDLPNWPGGHGPLVGGFYYLPYSVVSLPVNGACGSANGLAVSSKPVSNLCTAGAVSVVSGTGPWNWSCLGQNGGTTASCSAPLFTPTPTVNLKINGSDGPINLTQGQTRNFTWATTDATTCTASSNDIWSGSKAVPSGAESQVANVSSQSPDHDKLTCTGPGGTSSDSVQVNVACVPSTGAWEACLCPEEIKWRTNIGADCRSSREQGECTSSEKNSCRDFNWREVAP